MAKETWIATHEDGPTWRVAVDGSLSLAEMIDFFQRAIMIAVLQVSKKGQDPS